MDQHGSTWISRLQLAAVLTHGSCVMRQTHGSCVMRQTHGSCVRRPMRQASGVPRPTRQASDSTRPMRQASGVPCVRRQASHASGVRRPMRQASSVPRPSFSHRRPLSVMTDNKAAEIPPYATLSDLRLLSCTAWGNRVVLPTQYSATGAIVRIKTGRGVRMSAAACCHSTKKAGIMPAPLMVIRIPSQLPFRS